jgi:hypothetical protein
LLRFFPNLRENISCLDANKSTIFDPNTTTLETIVKASFIEKWAQEINYSSYSDLCAEIMCIAIVLGLYGGLLINLRVIIPLIIKVMFRRRQQTSSVNRSFRRLQELISDLHKLNLYRSAIHVEPPNIYQQHWST